MASQKTKINVVDSIMGSGKTTWAIHHMNEHNDARFIFVTPFKDEVKRIIEGCPHFKQPSDDLNDENGSYTKGQSLLNMLEDGLCIATTHQLFKNVHITEKIRRLIDDGGYTLILDEMIDAVEKINATKDDIDDISKRTKIEEGTQRLIWTDANYSGNHRGLERLIKTNTVIKYRDNLLLWLFPEDLLAAFGEIFVLTFLFEGSCMERYLLIKEFEYSTWYVDNGELVQGSQDISQQKSRIRDLIDVYDGKLNDKGANSNAYGKRWMIQQRKDAMKGIYNDALNYLKNKRKATAESILWTTFKKDRGRIKEPSINGRYADRFCPWNTKATNKWAECTELVYLVNVYQNPSINEWFKDHGQILDDTQYALSLLVQWIWRSAIRNGKQIHIYMPSSRMREILEQWLNS